MDIKTLIKWKAIIAANADVNLLNVNDLVNKNYGGSESATNVRTEGTISVTPGAAMLLTGLEVSQITIRFYDADGVYQEDNTINKYNTDHASFTVPDNSYFIRPKWYRSGADLPVAEVIASNPVIKYV